MHHVESALQIAFPQGNRGEWVARSCPTDLPERRRKEDLQCAWRVSVFILQCSIIPEAKVVLLTCLALASDVSTISIPNIPYGFTEYGDDRYAGLVLKYYKYGGRGAKNGTPAFWACFSGIIHRSASRRASAQVELLQRYFVKHIRSNVWQILLQPWGYIYSLHNMCIKTTLTEAMVSLPTYLKQWSRYDAESARLNSLKIEVPGLGRANICPNCVYHSKRCHWRLPLHADPANGKKLVGRVIFENSVGLDEKCVSWFGTQYR